MLSRQQKILPAFSGWPFADDSFLPYPSPIRMFFRWQLPKGCSILIASFRVFMDFTQCFNLER